MDEKRFVKLCKEAVVQYHNDIKCSHAVPIGDTGFCYNLEKITADDIYVVWLTKVLQNNKALLSTTLKDGMYYELTYNGDRNDLYLDAYKKEHNINFANLTGLE